MNSLHYKIKEETSLKTHLNTFDELLMKMKVKVKVLGLEIEEEQKAMILLC